MERPVELLVGGRYVLRVWSGTPEGHFAVVAEQAMRVSPFEGALLLFCNGERRILKALYWDRTGLWLWMKRLEKRRFPWPRDAREVREEIDRERLGLLLAGIDFWAAHEKLSYTHIG